jgi:hypothetical protein
MPPDWAVSGSALAVMCDASNIEPCGPGARSGLWASFRPGLLVDDASLPSSQSVVQYDPDGPVILVQFFGCSEVSDDEW